MKLQFHSNLFGYNKKEVDTYIKEIEQRYINLSEDFSRQITNIMLNAYHISASDDTTKNLLNLEIIKDIQNIQSGVMDSQSVVNPGIISHKPEVIPFTNLFSLKDGGIEEPPEPDMNIEEIVQEFSNERTDDQEEEEAQRRSTKKKKGQAVQTSSEEKNPVKCASLGSRNGKVKSAAARIGDFCYYAFMAFLVIMTLLGIISKGAPRRFAGFSAAVILTQSMQDDLPQDSLVITRSIHPEELKIGDDITYLVNPTTTITHRIVGITENFNDTGQRAFTTKGIMNEQQDELPVPAANVVGKVIFHNLTLGHIVQFLQRNWPIMVFGIILLTVLMKFFKWLYEKPQPSQRQSACQKNKSEDKG